MNNRTIAIVVLVAAGAFVAYKALTAGGLVNTPANRAASLLLSSQERLTIGQTAAANKPNIWATVALTAGQVAASYYGAGGVVSAAKAPEVNV